MKTEHDNKMSRCPKLGDEMTFSYCLREAGDLPCARIAACWEAVFDVTDVLKRALTAAQWSRFAGAEPKEKVLTLVELIEQAKRQK